jgi:hypothetical protein
MPVAYSHTDLFFTLLPLHLSIKNAIEEAFGVRPALGSHGLNPTPYTYDP